MCDLPDTSSIIRLENVSMSYNTPLSEVEAINNISFDIKKNEFVSIVGSSGCGKSTILSIISGLLKPTAGKVYYKNKQVLSTNNDMGYMLQHDHLFPWCSVLENVCIGLKIRNLDNKLNRQRVISMLNTYGLGEFINSFPRELSGGMRQRVALVRTLALDPEVLLLDEPFSALDYQTRIKVSDDIASIIRSKRKTAILVTHDISEAISLSDRVIILSKRPATIRSIIKINLESSHDVPSRRKSVKFAKYFDQIWEEMNNE